MATEQTPRPVKQPCTGCGADVLHIVDVDTDEPIVLDADRVDEGHVAVYAMGSAAVARRYGAPARVQPAWQVHLCPTPTVTTPPAPAADPYEDETPAAQQHGGWRA